MLLCEARLCIWSWTRKAAVPCCRKGQFRQWLPGRQQRDLGGGAGAAGYAEHRGAAYAAYRQGELCIHMLLAVWGPAGGLAVCV